MTYGARPFDFATNRVFAVILGDTQTPDDRAVPGDPVFVDGDIFVDIGGFGFYDLVNLDASGQPTGSFPFRRFVRPTRRWRYNGTAWVEDTTIDFSGVNFDDTHIDADLSVLFGVSGLYHLAY